MAESLEPWTEMVWLELLSHPAVAGVWACCVFQSTVGGWMQIHHDPTSTRQGESLGFVLFQSHFSFAMRDLSLYWSI